MLITMISSYRALCALLIIFAAFSFGCSDSSDTKPGTVTIGIGFQGEWQEHECEMTIPEGLSGEDFLCGTFVVPADWDSPGEEKRSFEVAILKARGETPKSDPVVFFGGGPGGWNLQGALAVRVDYLSPVLETRDLVFFDKRGGGLSAPNLFCAEYFNQFRQAYSVIADGREDADTLLVGLQDCYTRLTSNGIDVSHFNSYQIAADIAALMRALAYDTYNLYGSSYGALEEQIMVREHPEKIRSFILDSPTILERDTIAATDFERSLGVLFDTCDASISCSTRYPDLRSTLTDAVNRLNATPHYSPVTLPNGSTQDVYVTGDRLLVGLHQALYRAELIPLLPAFISNTAAGNFTLLDVFVPQLVQTGGYDWGLYAATLCAEEVPFYDAELISEARQQLDPLFSDPVYYFFTYVRINMCEFWKVATRPDIETKPLVSDIPALVLSGEYDPITSPADGELAASTLSKSQYFLFRGLGHGVLRSIPGGSGQLSCPQQVVTQFLDDPEMTVDSDCVAELPGIFD